MRDRACARAPSSRRPDAPGGDRMLRYGVRCSVLFLLALQIGLPRLAAATACPKVAVFESQDNASRLDLGWQGIFHQRPVSGWSLRMALGQCSGTPESGCGTCPVTGLVSNAGGR